MIRKVFHKTNYQLLYSSFPEYSVKLQELFLFETPEGINSFLFQDEYRVIFSRIHTGGKTLCGCVPGSSLNDIGIVSCLAYRCRLPGDVRCEDCISKHFPEREE